MATLQRTSTSTVGHTVAQIGFMNNLLQKLRPLILKKGIEVGAEYGLKSWSFGTVGSSGIPIDHIVLDEAKIEQLAREQLGLPYEICAINVDSVYIDVRFKSPGSSNLSFFSEIRAAGRAALDLFRERADAVLELNIAINSLEVHVTPRSVNDAEAAATAWEAAAEAASVQPAMVDDKLLALFLERTNITLAASTATFDIYEPFETESDRGPKLAVEELFVDRMRFRNAVTRTDIELAQTGETGLSQMERGVLKKLARSEGIAQAAIDVTDDEDPTNKALVALITEAMAAKTSRLSPTGVGKRGCAEGVPPDPEPQQEPQQAGDTNSPLARTKSLREIAQAPTICHLPSRDEIEKDGLLKLLTMEHYKYVAQLAGTRVLMEKEGPGKYCEFVYHYLGSYNEHSVQYESGTTTTYQGWNGALHRGFQSAQMQCVAITGHPQTDRCDGRYTWRGRWHDGWPLLEREKVASGDRYLPCYCYRGMGSRERRIGDAWVISDTDAYLDDEDWTGLGFLTCTPEQPLIGMEQSWRCCVVDGRWVDSTLVVHLLPSHE